MKHLGHIRITPDGIRFEYYELPKPDLKDFRKRPASMSAYGEYGKALKEYNTSLRKIEVSNVCSISAIYSEKILIHIKDFWFMKYIKNHQPCEAEVNGKAEITKIL